MFGCVSNPPLAVDGELPPAKPRYDKYYAGNELPREKTSLLVGAQAARQTSVFIVKVDGFKQPGNTSLIGGSVAAIVLPGKHDVTIQLHDKGRITIPLVLEDVEVNAGVGYLIGFDIKYPEDFNYLSGNEELRIVIFLKNLDTNEVVYERVFNGWGREV